MATVDQFVAKLNDEYILAVDPHLQERFRVLLAEYEQGTQSAPVRTITDGHQERADLGLEPTAVTPDYLKKSSGVDGDTGDWTKTTGAGITDETDPLLDPNPTDDKTLAPNAEHADNFEGADIGNGVNQSVSVTPAEPLHAPDTYPTPASETEASESDAAASSEQAAS